MYGQPKATRPPELAQADSEFVHGVAADFQGDRTAGSNDIWIAGEWYFMQGRVNLAMSRYNQAWLLDHTNYQAFWGFGRVLLRRNVTDEAVVHLEQAWRLCQASAPNVAVLAALASAYSLHAARSGASGKSRLQYQALADSAFQKCLGLDPEYSDGWVQWARALHRAGDYKAAAEKLEKARGLGAELPESFVSDLGKRASGAKRGGR
jgi:tetratricopeptide (TPR) repeat protein